MMQPALLKPQVREPGGRWNQFRPRADLFRPGYPRFDTAGVPGEVEALTTIPGGNSGHLGSCSGGLTAVMLGQVAIKV